MRPGELLEQHRATILAVAARHGATSVRVFGDIDFLVELEEGRSLLDLGGLLNDLHELLGQPVNVVTVRGLKERIRNRVLAEAVSL